MFCVVAYCSEYVPSACLLRVLSTRSQGATDDGCLLAVTAEHPTSPVLPEVVRGGTEGWRAEKVERCSLSIPGAALPPSKLSRIVGNRARPLGGSAFQNFDGGTAKASSRFKSY